MTAMLALTWPSRMPPESIRQWPSTLTSPLNRPATRTSPSPPIFPSVVNPDEMTVSLRVGLGAGALPAPGIRRVASLSAVGAERDGDGAAEVFGPGAGVSFQRAMSRILLNS